MIQNLTCQLLAVAAFVFGSTVFAAETATAPAGTVIPQAEPGAVMPKLPYKQAKEECMKERPELKSKALRECVKEKQRAAQ